MLLLAYHLLRKKLVAAWKAARKRGKTKKMNLGGEPKKRRQSPERTCPPTAATRPSAMKQGFRHVPAYDCQTSRQLISHRPVWQRVRIAVIFPMPQLLRFAGRFRQVMYSASEPSPERAEVLEIIGGQS